TSDAPASLSPTVSTSYARLQQAAASRGVTLEYALREFSEAARRGGKLSRVWGGPDNESAWELQVRAGISLINTDVPKVVPHYLDTPAENDLQLYIDPAEGHIEIRNASGRALTLSSYRIASFNGSLTRAQGRSTETDNSAASGSSDREAGDAFIQ